jgi:hypothetical protein
MQKVELKRNKNQKQNMNAEKRGWGGKTQSKYTVCMSKKTIMKAMYKNFQES